MRFPDRETVERVRKEYPARMDIKPQAFSR
jgi:hypothetical protein